MKNKYPGICARFGETNMFVAAILAPSFLNLSFNRQASLPFLISSTAIMLAAGFLGYTQACGKHNNLVETLEKQRVPIKKARGIIERGQAISYAIPVGLAFLMSTMIGGCVKKETPHPEGPAPLVQEL